MSLFLNLLIMIVSERAEGHLPHSYLLLRLGIGLCFAFHGALRFSQEGYFTEILDTYTITGYGDMLLLVYAYLMPGIELIAGLLLCFGFLKRLAISGLGVVMIIWILSSVMMDYWQNMAAQLLFFFILYWLYFKIKDDHWSFDTFLKHY